LDRIEENSVRVEETYRYKFESLVTIFLNCGFKSVYILVDRVDELTITTNDAGKAFSFLREILVDLPLLETKGVAFKFFLWDQMKEHYQEAGGRPDRLIEYSLDWSSSELENVLARRMSTYSDGQISKFDQLVEPGSGYNVHRMLAHFAHNSPRDLIRICKKIVDEHTRSGTFAKLISFRTIKSALQSFCGERARELYGAQLTELKKISEINFTISHLASDVFRISGQAARSKVQKWQDSGAAIKIGEVPNPGNRPQYLYGIVDPRLALAIMNDSSLEEAMENWLLLCPHCHDLRIAYEAQITCPNCQGNFDTKDAKTLAIHCAEI
jgi:hypothetical protein